LKELKIMGRSYADIPNPERNRGKERNEFKLLSRPTPVKGLQHIYSSLVPRMQEMNTKINERCKIANKSFGKC